jgi:hypothetical protein
VFSSEADTGSPEENTMKQGNLEPLWLLSGETPARPICKNIDIGAAGDVPLRLGSSRLC